MKLKGKWIIQQLYPSCWGCKTPVVLGKFKSNSLIKYVDGTQRIIDPYIELYDYYALFDSEEEAREYVEKSGMKVVDGDLRRKTKDYE